MNKRIGSAILCLLIIVTTLVSSVSMVRGEELTDISVGNKAQTAISSIERYIPKEMDGVDSAEIEEGEIFVRLEIYAKYARFLYYIEELEIIEEKHPTQTTDIVKDSLDYYKKLRETYSKKFNGMIKPEVVLDYIIKEAEESMDEITNEVINSQGTGVDVYRENFQMIKANVKAWSDSIRFYRDELKISDAKYKTLTDDFHVVYDKITQVNRELGLDLDLGYIRPESTYEQRLSVSQNMFDDEGKMEDWYLEIITLSALSDGERLDELKYKLSGETRKLYEKYANYRVPLRVGMEDNAVTNLNKRGLVTTKMSNLQDFIDGRNNEQVLYLPVHDLAKNVEREEVTTEEEVADGGVKQGEEVDISEVGAKFEPVYIKGDSSPLMKDEGSKFDIAGEEGRNTDPYSTALMNHIQFINYYQSGKLNDMQQDMLYPLFMDMFGNIQTYSGRIIIPAVANMSLMKEDRYFPLNAYFINSYPTESSGREIDNLLRPDPNKYVIKVEEPQVRVQTDSDRDTNLEKDLQLSMIANYKMARFKKSNILSSEYKISLGDRFKSIAQRLPTIIPYIESGSEENPDRTMFMNVTTLGGGGLFGKINEYKILGLKEQAVLDVEGNQIPFTFINEQVPVEIWNYLYFRGEDGDRGRFDNPRFRKITESAFNSEVDFDILKGSPTMKKSQGFSFGSMVEPIHKIMSQSSRNYVLHTPSIAEVPLLGKYISILLVPLLRLITVVMAVYIGIRYLRNIGGMSLRELIVSLLILITVNQGITHFYPTVINTFFNGSVSRVFGTQAYNLTLYNIEKDLNSKGEFIYTDKPSKIISDGSYIKLAELDDLEIKRFRKAEDNAPWKGESYYIPKWDATRMNIGNLFVQQDSLYMYTKDLFASAEVNYNGFDYEVGWSRYPDYSYYMPYLSILEGVTQTINSYTGGVFTPKTIKYSNGHKGASGGTLAYFNSEVFLTDNGTARGKEETDPEFYEKWVKHNDGDFLNLRSVMYVDAEAGSKFDFPINTADRVRSSRWYRTAINGRNFGQIEKKILDVNLKTKRYIFKLLPYMDNLTDDVVLKMISLNAMENFNKEFSMNPLEKSIVIRDWALSKINRSDSRDYFTTIHPQKLHLDTITIDEQMKMSLVNMGDLLKFNITSLYKQVENESTWFGMLLLFLNSLLLHFKSLLRIVFITVFLAIIMTYMIFVYALRRDYDNKLAFGMVGVIFHSWAVFMGDNLATLLFTNLDKSSAGVLVLILLGWLMWNIFSLLIYLQLFMVVIGDISAFGGNIFHERMYATQEALTNLGQKMLRPLSKTRSENFDLRDASHIEKAEDFEEYLNLDPEIKFQHQRDKMQVGTNALVGVGVGLAGAGAGLAGSEIKKSLLGDGVNVREMYKQHQGSEYINMSLNPLTLNRDQEYMESFGITVTKERDGIIVGGEKEAWETMMQSSTIQTDGFDGLYKEHNDSMYFPKSDMTSDFLKRSGTNYQELDKNTFEVRGVYKSDVNSVMDTLKSPLFRIDGELNETLRRAEEYSSPGEYEVGANHVYFKEEGRARQIFDEDKVSQTFKTLHPITDYQDKLKTTNGYINDSIDFVNGMMVTGEFIYGKPTKALRTLLGEKELKLEPRGKEAFKFDMGRREEILDSVRKSARYTAGTEGVLFREKTELDRVFAERGEGFDNMQPKPEELGGYDYSDYENENVGIQENRGLNKAKEEEDEEDPIGDIKF